MKDLTHLPIIEQKHLAQITNQDIHFADDILDLLIKELPKDLSTIKQHFQHQNYTEMRRQVHRLHGALCYSGTPRLKMLVAHLESELKNNIMESLPSLLNQLDIEVNLLLEYYCGKNS